MATSKVVVTNLTEHGLITDIAPFQTPPNAFTSARNVSFENMGVTKAGHRVEVLIPTDEVVTGIYSKNGRVYFTGHDKIFMNTGYEVTDITGKTVSDSIVGDYKWTITELSNVLVFHNPNDNPMTFKLSDTEVKQLEGWGHSTDGSEVSWKCKSIMPFKNFLVALSMTEAGVAYPQRVRWSDLALPNEAPASWDASDTTKSAGFNDLSEARGEIIYGLPFKDTMFLYTTEEVFQMNYVGGNDIFSFRKVFDNVSLLAPECVCAVNAGHFVVTSSDIIVHNGSSFQSVVTDKIKKDLFSEIAKGDPSKVKVQTYPAKNEVWVCYPTSKVSENSVIPTWGKAAIYNLDNNTWTYRDLPDFTAINYGVFPTVQEPVINSYTETIINTDNDIINGNGQDFVKGCLFAATAPYSVKDQQTGNDTGEVVPSKFWAINEGATGNSNLPCSLIKQNMDFDDWGVDPTQHKLIKAVYPQFLGAGQVMISIGVSQNPYDAPKWSTAKPFNINTDRKVDFRATGRYISIKFESFGTEYWTLMSYGIEGQPRGGR